ncbi:phosphotransferase [Rhizobium sp. XQZ8]|uniref:phosphotransferase n=1 Tax=Rhizobium populisoli TaxID=2859785 RepID=UPI001CA5D7AC|nr:phosphotransferase [Rhizobium populisoli]MBW6424342.1 phosphotransferase [Rhizobium populisoli]
MSQAPAKSASNNMLTAKLERTPLERVETIAADHFGFAGRATVLSSERDETFLVETSDGRRAVLKIANSAEREDVLQFQTDALRHLEEKRLPLPLPKAIPESDGRFLIGLGFAGQQRLVRMLTFLDGVQLHKVARSRSQMQALGAGLAVLGQGLADFKAGVPSQGLLWDIYNAGALRPQAICVDPGHRDLVLAALDGFDQLTSYGMGELRRQVIHNDFNPHNILVAANDPSAISGVIDFGDLVEAPLINDLAVALSYQAGNDRGMEMMSAMLHAYHAVRPLLRNEIDALPCLLRTRLAMTVIIPEWRAGLYPENRDYILRNHPLALAGLTRLANHSDGEIAAFFRQNLGDFA